jgi:hypothetical protein
MRASRGPVFLDKLAQAFSRFIINYLFKTKSELTEHDRVKSDPDTLLRLGYARVFAKHF